MKALTYLHTLWKPANSIKIVIHYRKNEGRSMLLTEEEPIT